MTDWKAAGLKADAHRVIGLLTAPYSGAPKAKVRDRAIRFLVAQQPKLVLDAWGGGMSADAQVAAGLSVLSVDDGRSFREQGISPARGLRAMTIAGEEGGYRTASGRLAKHASECDAAFLDFCGQWSPEVARTIRACAHMSAIAVTIMPERTPLGRLSPADWLIAYRALLTAHSGMSVRWAERYTRSASGQGAMVFALVRVSASVPRECPQCGDPNLRRWGAKYCSDTCATTAYEPTARARARARHAVHREEKVAYLRAYYAVHREEILTKARAKREADRALRSAA